MQLLIPLLFTCCIASCKPHVNCTAYHLSSMTLIDSGFKPGDYLKFDEEGIYPIYYIGQVQDTVTIHNRYSWERKWQEYHPVFCSATYSAKTLDLYVYTSIKTNISVEHYLPDGRKQKDATRNLHANLLTIRNISDSSLYLGMTYLLYHVHREARDRNGNWVTIDSEVKEGDICGTGQPEIFLEKNNLIIAKVPRYKGSLVTDFRLAFGDKNNVVYSNTWRDSVDERTLKLKTKNKE